MKYNEKLYENIYNQIKHWILEKMFGIGTKKAIIGVSGGADSALSLILTAEAIGAKNVIGVLMPAWTIKGTEGGFIVNKNMDAAEKLCTSLGINFLTVNIKDTAIDLEGRVSSNIDPPISNMAHGNLCARIRMSTLYLLANLHNGLVIGTTNKTEMELGYYTKYGDGGVDIEPIADMYKTQVYHLLKYIRDISRIDLAKLIEEAIATPPSADFWEGQTDEEEFGYTYSKIDNVLGHADGKLDVEETEIYEKLRGNFMIKNKHKLNPNIPVCKPAISQALIKEIIGEGWES